VCRGLVGKPAGGWPHRKPRCRWEDNIKMDLNETGWEKIVLLNSLNPPTGCDALADLFCDQIHKHVQMKVCQHFYCPT
jgi:hypothetical protein